MDTLSPKLKKRSFPFYNQGLTAWQGMYRTIHSIFLYKKIFNQINRLQAPPKDTEDRVAIEDRVRFILALYKS